MRSCELHRAVGNRLSAGSLLIIGLILPTLVWGHVDSSESGGFVAGFSHPLSGLDHVIAMLAVGLWGAQLGVPAVWVLPLVFPMIMAVGGFLGLVGLLLPGVEVGIALSAVVLGLVVLLEYRAGLGTAMLIVAFFGLFHGQAHGAELPAGQSALLFSFGFVIATGLLHGAGITVGILHRWPWGQIWLRSAGAAVLLGGCLFLGVALA